MFKKLFGRCGNTLKYISFLTSKKNGWKYMVYTGTAIISTNIATCNFIDTIETGNKKLNAAQYMAKPITNPDQLFNTPDDIKTKMELLIMKIQTDFIRFLENEENSGKKFIVDRWLRKEGGGGITCVLQNGDTFEKAGVNTSVVSGILTPGAAQQMRSSGKKLVEGNLEFFAASCSAVIHPRNPMVPSIHFNYRYFEVIDENGEKLWWFGGGTDLTPYYLDVLDIKHFHQTLKAACDEHDSSYYPKFKKLCDEYFRIHHREECRGVGGIFFDDLDTPSQEKAFLFISSCVNATIPAYMPIVRKHKNDEYGSQQREWQLLCRGKYIEFNLLYDRGIQFGLHTPGSRYESILMSLPLTARWEYMNDPKEGTEEAKLTHILKNPYDWVGLDDQKV